MTGNRKCAVAFGLDSHFHQAACVCSFVGGWLGVRYLLFCCCVRLDVPSSASRKFIRLRWVQTDAEICDLTEDEDACGWRAERGKEGGTPV